MNSTAGGLRLISQSCRKSGLSPSLVFCFSSKTPIKSNLGAVSSTSTTPPRGTPFPYQFPPNEKVNLVSQPTKSTTPKNIRKRKEILRMPEEELEGYAILQKRPSLSDRRGDAGPAYLNIMEPEKRNYVDWFAKVHGDWDFRQQNLKRWYASVSAENDIKLQEYNSKRNQVLGNDLALAHFIVYRKGKVRFMGETQWITEYRKDAVKGKDEDDLPAMRFDLCTLPINYDPRFRVEAVDCAGVPLHYEGLLNFENLNYVKWLSFRNSPHLDDWCMGRITRIFYETLEYIDLSGCPQISERGIGTLARCKNLKTLVVENLPHVKHIEMIAALLEDQFPELSVIGIDYAKRMEQLRLEGEEIERKIKETEAQLESNTIESTSTPVINPTDVEGSKSSSKS